MQSRLFYFVQNARNCEREIFASNNVDRIMSFGITDVYQDVSI